jgi:predicted DNA binding protein
MGGTIAELELPAEEFALHETLRRLEGIEFEIERVVAHDSDQVMPYVWASSIGDADLEAALEDDPSVESLEVLADLGEERLYRMHWIDDIDTLVRILVEEDGTILAAFGRSESWALRTLFPEREALSRTHEFCEEAGLTMHIDSIYRLDEGRGGRFGLTETQQSTLLEAFEQGYYDVPRTVTADELATEIDISHQALSEQLRRAHGTLVENAIVIGRGAEK